MFRSIRAALALAIAAACLIGAPAFAQATRCISCYPQATSPLTGSDNLLGYRGSQMELVSSAQLAAYSNSLLTTPEIVTALGFTPANKAGDTFTGAVTIPSLNVTSTLTLPSASVLASNLAANAAVTSLGFTPLNRAQNLADAANLPAVRANIKAEKVVTLESFAAGLGVTLGGSDDAAVWTVADAAIVSAAGSGGLAVSMPLNVIERTSVGPKLANNGGYFCPVAGECTVQEVRNTSDATNNYFVTQNTPFDTNKIFWGINVVGGPSTFSTPWPTAWLDHEHGINISTSYNGVSDGTFVSNNLIGAQEPNDQIGYVKIANFGGDCLTLTGAGSSTYGPFILFGCGGHGVDINGYDSKIVSLDIGATGRSGFYGHGSFSSYQIGELKTWYNGQRGIAGDNYGLWLVGVASDFFYNYFGQDTTGDMIHLDNSSNIHVFGTCQWQGQIPNQDTAVACLGLYGVDHSFFNISASIPGYAATTYPTVNVLVHDGLSTSNVYNGSYSTYNVINILADGFAQDQQTFNPAWVIGPLDTTNALTVNGTQRVPRRWLTDPATDEASFGIQANGSLTGCLSNGPNAPYPNNFACIVQKSGVGQLQGYVDTATNAQATLTSTGNYNEGDDIVIGSTVYVFHSVITPPVQITANPIAGTSMTVTAASANTIKVGDPVTGLGLVANTVITGQTSGTTGGAGVYTINNAQSVSYANLATGTGQVHLGATEGISISNLAHAIDAVRPKYFQGYIAGSTLNDMIPQAGLLAQGDTLTSFAVGSANVTAGTYISGAQSAGQPGSAGTYPISASQTVGSSTGYVPFVAYAGIAGADFGYGLMPNLSVTAAVTGAHTIVVTAISEGVIGNTINVGKTSSAASWSGSTLSGGLDGARTYNNALQWHPDGSIFLFNGMTVPTYADDTAAAAGGIRHFQVYLDTTGAVHSCLTCS